MKKFHLKIKTAKKFTTVKDIFGTFRNKRNTQQLLHEIDDKLDT